MSIQDTPHYQYVIGNKNIYKEYYEQHMGLQLKHVIIVQVHIENLIEKFDCQKYNSNPTMYIKTNSKFLINDGCHRVSILMNNGFKTNICKNNIIHFTIFIINVYLKNTFIY